MKQPRKVSSYLLAWSLWAVTSALGVFILFWAVRDAIRAVAEAVTMSALLHGSTAEQFQVPYIRNAVDRFSIVGLGMLSVLLVVGIEHFLRTGVDRGMFWKRLILVFTIEFGVLFVALAIQSVYLGVLGLFTTWSLLLPACVLGMTGLLAWLLARMSRSTPAV